MCSRNRCASVAVLILALVMVTAAAGVTAAASVTAQVADAAQTPPAGLIADAEPERAVVVPLPPALGTGLAGLAAMAVLRVGRRVYRRH